jgi:hypothetical protein
MNSANEKYGSSLDRPQAPSKPIDPATRLSELLAQSLEELTRPFDSPRAGPHPSRPVAPLEEAPASAVAPQHDPPPGPTPEPSPEEARIDADKALAELEAELFAAAKQVDRDTTIPHEEHAEEHFGDSELPPEPAVHGVGTHAQEAETETAAEPEVVPPLAPEEPASQSAEPAHDADAARVIAKVRRLMLVSMAVTVIAVGAVFGFVGYRIFKGEGMVEKKADKLPESSPIPNDITLSLPRSARVVQSAVANDRLIMTLEIDGKIEVRTFDVKTLQPAGRLNFSATP